MDKEEAAETVRAFRIVQRLRSGGAAHRKSEDYAEETARLIPGVPSRSAFRELLGLLTNALSAIARALNESRVNGVQ